MDAQTKNQLIVTTKSVVTFERISYVYKKYTYAASMRQKTVEFFLKKIEYMIFDIR